MQLVFVVIFEQVDGMRAPFRLVAEVVVVALVPEEHEFVGPKRCLQLRGQHDLPDKLLLASQRIRLILGQDVVKECSSLDFGQSIEDFH